MKELISKIKEKDNICIFFLFLIISLGVILSLSIEASDEVWNFQNVYKMYNGLKIYEDINVIITPLFFWCAQLMLELFGSNLFIFRISHCILMTFLFFYTYILLKKLNIPKSISITTVLVIAVQQEFGLMRTAFNYNNMALLFFIIGVYFLINEKTRKKIWIQSLITIIIILIKQNMGIYYLIGNIIYILISKNEVKEKIKKSIKYVSIILLGGIIFIIYLILDNNLYNFYSYVFGGLSEFAKENLAFNIVNVCFVASMLVLNTIISFMILKKPICTEEEKNNIKILLIFSMLLMLVCYPIFNDLHIFIGIYLIIINLVYIIYTLFSDFKKGIQKVTNVINIILIIGMLIYSLYNLYMWANIITDETYPYTWEDPFFGGIIEDTEEYEKGENIIAYIKDNEKNVVVLSYKAAMYMVPLNRNNGDLDLIFKGNFGLKGEDGVIEELQNMENTQFLILKDEEDKIYQESDKIKDYIKSTKECIGEIEDFYIYE